MRVDVTRGRHKHLHEMHIRLTRALKHTNEDSYRHNKLISKFIQKYKHAS